MKKAPDPLRRRSGAILREHPQRDSKEFTTRVRFGPERGLTTVVPDRSRVYLTLMLTSQRRRLSRHDRHLHPGPGRDRRSPCRCARAA